MKIILSIILVLITLTYVLPIKDIIANDNTICVVDTEEENNVEVKKQKLKEVFIVENTSLIANLKYKSTHHFTTLTIPLLLHKVETPPPNFI